MQTPVKGALIAAAVASLFAARIAIAAEPEGATGEAKKVHCEGVNECKGHGECGGAGHDCAGMNSCKGKGWVTLSEAECKAKGGKVRD
jgi:uncharacterized membrane protein